MKGLGKIVLLLVCLFMAGCQSKKVVQEKEHTQMIEIIVGNHTLHAKLENNSSAEAFVSMLEKEPLTLMMSDYGNFEKVGDIGKTLPRNDTRISTEPGDIILYQGSSITIYYDNNTWEFTRLGKIDNTSKEELLNILGKGDVEVTFQIADVPKGKQ